MTDPEMYELLCAKAQNIKMHMCPEDVAVIAKRFGELIEKQVAKKVEIVLHENRIPSEREEPYCPSCEEWIGWDSRDTKYCYNCGQRIDWS